MLTLEQQEQIEKQIAAYEKLEGTVKVCITLDPGSVELEVDTLVANPEIMNSGIEVTNYLVKHPEVVKGKIVTDMGTGCGVIGIVSKLLGAKQVFMSDVDPKAVSNASRNIQQLNLEGCKIFESDLFSHFVGKPNAQVQIFNYPFFEGSPVIGKEWTRMMLGGTKLLFRYLKEAPQYSTRDADYILPWFTLAESHSYDNDPAKLAAGCGYKVISEMEQAPKNQGLQKALFKILVLKKLR